MSDLDREFPPDPELLDAQFAEMSLRIMGMARTQGTVFTEAELIQHLHGMSTPEMQTLVIESIRRGFDSRRLAPRIPFAQMCLEADNFELLERVVRAGPPDHFRVERVGDSKSAWLDWLCSNTNDGAYFNGIVQRNPFDLVLEHYFKDSARFIRLAHEFDPNHRALVQEAQGCAPVRDETMHPGNFHFALLHEVMNGQTPTATPQSMVGKKEPYKVDNSERGLRRHQAALECLEFLRSVGSKPWLSEGKPLDAVIFVTGFNIGSRYDTVRQLMETYRDLGVLDINERIPKARRNFGGKLPIEAAIHVGAAGAAAALIDMGCELETLTAARGHDGDLVRYAESCGRPHVTAAVTEALMRKRLAQLSESGPAANAESGPESAAAPARRRRVSL